MVRSSGYRHSAEAETAASKQSAGLVVLLALSLIRQHVVGFGDLLEALFGRALPGF